MSDLSKYREQLAEVLIEEGAGPGNSIHSWRCAYPDRYGPCSCVEEATDALLASPVLAQMLAEAKAEALREAADAWTRGGWSDVMLPKPAPPAVPVIAYSNRVGDWLRDCAEASDQEGEQ